MVFPAQSMPKLRTEETGGRPVVQADRMHDKIQTVLLMCPSEIQFEEILPLGHIQFV